MATPSLTSINGSTLNLGLLETCIPLSSIVTVSVVVGFVLPRQQPLGLFVLIWWWWSVLISLATIRGGNNVDGDGTTTQDESGFLFESSMGWSTGDWRGVAVLVGSNVAVLGILYVWFQRPAGVGIQRFVLQRIPIWGMIALNIYRLDGLSIVAPFYHGTVPTFIGFQTIVLDAWMGATAIPLAFLSHPKFSERCRPLLGQQRLKEMLWMWNSLGLYDLCSAYFIFLLNWAGIGGEWITQPPLCKLGFHPFPLLILFQVPLAIAIHVLCLRYMDELMDQIPTNGLPLHIRRLRASKY
jgi:hypothetical protein